MAEYIDRETVIRILSYPIPMSMCLDVNECKNKRIQREIDLRLIKFIPVADVQPVVHGKWEEDIQCSECGWYMEDDVTISPMMVFFNYCPNCGAKMDGGRQ